MPEQQDLVKLGPWPKGVNNKQDETSSVYVAVESDGLANKKLAQLREAVNVDFDDEGWVSKRKGFSQVLSLTNGHSAHTIDNKCYLVDNGNLKHFNGSALETITSGIGDTPMLFEKVGKDVFWVNDNYVGRITQSNVGSYWGISNPGKPVLEYNPIGDLLPGIYLVYLTYETEDEIESGSSNPTTITLTSKGGIDVTWMINDINAEYVNIYVTGVNQKEAKWQVRKTATLYTTLITDVNISTDPLTTFNMYPPPKGHLLFRHGGFMMVAVNNILYWSQPLAYHLFKISTDFQIFPSKIVLGESAETGFYIATEDERVYWISGIDPDKWERTEKARIQVSEGRALRERSDVIDPRLNTNTVVPVFNTSRGIVAGLPSGELRYITEDSLSLNGYSRSAMTKIDNDGKERIISTMIDKKKDSSFVASDRSTASIIRNAFMEEPEIFYFGDNMEATIS